ncbi:MAG: chromate efflux transporter [Mesorhizobium sp.]
MTEPLPDDSATARHGGNPGEVFAAFLKLGLTSFGGPIAHLGYFRNELVVRRGWVTDRFYLDLVALCQFLPGPASSQVGFALGLWRAGPLGALAAWAGFTLPSALLLVAFAGGMTVLDGPGMAGILHGLKLAAVAVVAQAVWGMARGFCRSFTTVLIAVAAFALLATVHLPLMQLVVIAGGAAAGAVLLRGSGEAGPATLDFGISHRTGSVALALFFGLLVLLPLARSLSADHVLAVIDAFYRAGALVFGGGHVVLPLLEREVVTTGWIGKEMFLAGYGAAQAVPGPLFTFAAFLGAALHPAPNGIFGAALALVAIFLPGLLLLVGVLPFWARLSGAANVRAALAGANAAVVGLLAAALYDPLISTTVAGPADALVALAGGLLLVAWKVPPLVIVLLSAAAGFLLV